MQSASNSDYLLANSFTIAEGGIIPKLDTLIKEAGIIGLLILKQEEEDGKTITEIRNAHLLASHSLNHKFTVQTSVEGSPIQYREFKYEKLGG